LRGDSEELIESNFSGTSRALYRRDGRQDWKISKGRRRDAILDEIGDMRPRTQSKVLRVLEEQRFERVGSKRNLERRRARHCRNEQASRTGNRARHFFARIFSIA